ncbi:hypothetical protein STEG23_037712, partial [Scotinomys teguina]
GKVWLIDFNPFGEVTDSLLFTWEELTSENNLRGDFSEGDDQGQDSPAFRCTNSEATVQPSPYLSYRLPKDFVDLSTGEDAHKLIDFLKLDSLNPERQDLMETSHLELSVQACRVPSCTKDTRTWGEGSVKAPGQLRHVHIPTCKSTHILILTSLAFLCVSLADLELTCSVEQAGLELRYLLASASGSQLSPVLELKEISQEMAGDGSFDKVPGWGLEIADVDRSMYYCYMEVDLKLWKKMRGIKGPAKYFQRAVNYSKRAFLKMISRCFLHNHGSKGKLETVKRQLEQRFLANTKPSIDDKSFILRPQMHLCFSTQFTFS